MAYARLENHGRIDVFYLDEGEGPPVVLIGGSASTAEVWDPIAPALAERHRVLRPDKRGSGRTVMHEDDGVRSAQRMAGDGLGLFDFLGMERAHVLGGSMGGCVAQELALSRPDRILSLVLACASHGGPDAIRPGPEVGSILSKSVAPDATDADREAVLGIGFHPRHPASPPRRGGVVPAEQQAYPDSLEELGRRSEAMRSFDASDRLATLEVPLLAMAGDSNRLVPTDNARSIARRAPNSELLIFERAGHVFHAEHPAAAVEALVDFFARTG